MKLLVECFMLIACVRCHGSHGSSHGAGHKADHAHPNKMHNSKMAQDIEYVFLKSPHAFFIWNLNINSNLKIKPYQGAFEGADQC